MNYFKLPKVGLRTFKSGLAVFLCLLLIPNEPFFACLTAVICLGDTVTNSVDTGINRGGGCLDKGYVHQGKVLTNDELQVINKALTLLQKSKSEYVDQELIANLITRFTYNDHKI